MSEADKLLDSLDEGENNVVEEYEEPHIVINEDRSITVPPELKEIAVQFDHDVETVTFDCPRWWDGHDMFNMNVHINYMTPDGKVHYYIARDKVLDKEDENIMHFAWTFSRNVTEVKGSIKFLVCIKNVNAEGEEVNHWNSKLNTDLYILEGLESDTAEIIDKYPDIIEGLLKRMDDLEEIGLSTKIDIEELSHNGRRANKVIITSSSGVKEFIVTDGVDFIPHVSEEGELSWTNNVGLENPEPVNVRGATFTPSVDEQGNISWTNDKGLKNPETKNVTGPRGLTGAIFTPIEFNNEGDAVVDPKRAYRVIYPGGLIRSTSTAVLDMPIKEAATASVGNRFIYIFGGVEYRSLQNPSIVTNTIRKFDTVTQTITTISETLPQSLRGVSAITVGNYIYLFGGCKTYGYTPNPGDLVDTIYRFDTSTDTIELISENQFAGFKFYEAGVAKVDDRIYIFGGKGKNDEKITTCNSFDITTSKVTQLCTNSGFGGSVTAAIPHGEYIYIFKEGNSNFYKYNPATKETIRSERYFGYYIGRSRTGVYKIGNLIYFLGIASGYDPYYMYKYICVFNPHAPEASAVSILATQIDKRSMWGMVNEKIYGIGEFDERSYDVYVLSGFLNKTVISLQYANGSRNFSMSDKFDEFDYYFTFEIIALLLTDDLKELTIAYQLNGERRIEKITSDTAFDLSTCELRISGAEQVLMYNIDTGLPIALKIVSTNLIGQDENGGNIYEQVFDNGMTQRFTAPKGKDSEVEVVRLL